MKTPVYETEQIERILKKTGGFYILHDTTRMQRERILKNMQPLLQSGAMKFIGSKNGAHQYQYITPHNANKLKAKKQREKIKSNELSNSKLMDSFITKGTLVWPKEPKQTRYSQKLFSLLANMVDAGLLSKSTKLDKVHYTLAHPSLENKDAMEILAGHSINHIVSELRNTYRKLRNYSDNAEMSILLQATLQNHIGEAPSINDINNMLFKNDITATELIIKTINKVDINKPKTSVTKNTYFQKGQATPLLPYFSNPNEKSLQFGCGELTAYDIDHTRLKNIPLEPSERWVKKINSTGLSADNFLASSDADVFSMLNESKIQKELLARAEYGYILTNSVIAFNKSDVSKSNIDPTFLNQYINVYGLIDKVIKANPFTMDLEDEQQISRFSSELKKNGVTIPLLGEKSLWYTSLVGGAQLLTSIHLNNNTPKPIPQTETPSKAQGCTQKIKAP